MNKELKTSGGVIDLAPENLLVVNKYLEHGLNVAAVAADLRMPEQAVMEIIEAPACTSYIHKQFDAVMHAKQDKISQTFEMIIAKQLEEAAQTGVLTTKDLVEVLKMYADIQFKANEQRQKQHATRISSQNNINIGNDAIEQTGMGALMEKMMAKRNPPIEGEAE